VKSNRPRLIHGEQNNDSSKIQFRVPVTENRYWLTQEAAELKKKKKNTEPPRSLPRARFGCRPQTINCVTTRN
jgi:hypothetical protein